jgi:chromosome partitioning protein
VKEAPAQGQTIFEYASGTNAADDYLVVVENILQSREGSRASAETRASLAAAGA